MSRKNGQFEDHQKLITRGEAMALFAQLQFDYTRMVLDGRYLLNPDRPQPPHSDKPD